MIIGKPEMTEEQDDVCLSAEIHVETAHADTPKKLWFKIPKEHAGHVDAGIDAFVVGLLPSAMNIGEDINAEGEVSPKLAFGLNHYQHMHALWRPDKYSRVKITYAGYEARTCGRSKAVGLAFSGGIDSSYTLWKHHAQQEPIPDYQITHALVINGFDRDADLNFEGHFRKLRQTYEPMLKSHRVEFVTVRTNLKSFREALCKPGTGLENSYGAALSAVALACGGFFSKFYIPGSAQLPRDKQHPEGTHVLLDSWLSNECLDFIHDGADATRVDKTVAISKWPVMHDCLRVCTGKPTYNDATGLFENCGRCEKCIRTMCALEATGELEKFRTFPKPLDLGLVRKARFKSESAQKFSRENLELARQMGRKDLVAALRCAMWRGKLSRLISRKTLRKLSGKSTASF